MKTVFELINDLLKGFKKCSATTGYVMGNKVI